jgi:hypothetical protein
MDSLEFMAAESSPLSPELRNRNKRKETTHYQRASLGRYTTYTQSSNHLTFIKQQTFMGCQQFCLSPNSCVTKDVSLDFKVVGPLFLFDPTLNGQFIICLLKSFMTSCLQLGSRSFNRSRPTTWIVFQDSALQKKTTTRFCELAITLVMDHRLFLGKSPHCATGHLIYLVAPIP